MIGKTISHYKIVEELGRGGMGVVYKATDLHLKRTVALKIPRPDLMADPEVRRRFVKEAQAAAVLDHPNICTIHEISQAEGFHFIVMEYVAGKSLKAIIAGEGLALGRILDIGLQVAEALAEAHDKQVIHRDIKSANIMVTERGLVKITDFGLAKQTAVGAEAATLESLTQQGELLGTLGCMSPEQVRAEAVDGRSDIFSFGVVLYEMVTGQWPFERDNIAATVEAILHQPAEPLARYRNDVPIELERVVGKMLAKERAERYQTVKDVALDLRNLKKELAGEGATAVRIPAPIPPKKRSWLKLGLLVGLLVLAASALGLWLYFPRPVLPFAERDWLLVSDFENHTGDAVFDKSLKQALVISLEQSRYVNVYPPARVREALRRMKQDIERIDEKVGREICLRENIRALLVGSISGIGENYSLAVKIIDPTSGMTVKTVGLRAESKNQVLNKIEKLAKQAREKLGEAVASIAKSNKKLEEVTTASLEALKYYSLGLEQHHLKGNANEAIAFYKTAIAVDQDFASAYKSLAAAYDTLYNKSEVRRYAQKAFELKEKVTDREKFHIEALYDMLFGRYDSAIDSYKKLIRLYPDDLAAHGNLGRIYNEVGQFERSLLEYQETLRISPNSAFTYANLAFAALSLNKYDDSIQYAAKALEINPQSDLFNLVSAYLGKGELERARAQCAKMIASGDLRLKLLGKERLAVALLYEGRLAAAQSELLGSILLGEKFKPNYEAQVRRFKATLHELTGDKQNLIEELNRVVNLSDRMEGYYGLLNLAYAGKLQARSGQLEKAKKAIDILQGKVDNEQSNQGKALWDLVHGEIELKSGNYTEALSSFQRAATSPTRYEYLQVHESLAHCYFAVRDYDQAIREYEIPISQKGLTLDYWAGVPHLWITAHYWLGRAYQEKGAKERAVEHYQRFISLWQSAADRNLPMVQDAKRRWAMLTP